MLDMPMNVQKSGTWNQFGDISLKQYFMMQHQAQDKADKKNAYCSQQYQDRAGKKKFMKAQVETSIGRDFAEREN